MLQIVAKILKLSAKMLKLFPMRHQLSHRRHPLHPSSIRDVRSQLRIRFLKSLNDLRVLSFLSSLLHKMGPKYRRECLPNETVLNLGKRKSEFVRIRVKVGILESFKVGRYTNKLTGSNHLN